LTEALAMEMGPHKIDVNAIFLGPTNIGMMEQFLIIEKAGSDLTLGEFKKDIKTNSISKT
jgi:hypothetical protein